MNWGNGYRSYGNKLWEFDDEGLMRRRLASINDAPKRTLLNDFELLVFH
jgi:nuclear transport factor 2 (NTF2) superfamily protein